MSSTQEQIPDEEMEKYSKQMQDKFMKDLENIQIGDSDSELQGSSDFYEGLKKKLNTQITNMRQSTTTNTIIQELKATLNKEITNAEQFQEEIKEMKYLNTEAKSAINQQQILEIKSKLAQTINQSKIVLAEQIVELRQSQIKQELQNNAIFQQVECQQQETQIQEPSQLHKTKRPLLKKSQKASTLISSSSSSKLQFKKKSPQTSIPITSANKNVNNKIQKKLNEINLQRERINMQREDQRSMKYEKQSISQFFSQRFLTFRMPKTQTIKLPQNIITITKPKSTFTNLEPLINNEKNVVPKNSPQIALKALKKSKRVSLLPTSQTIIKIEFKKVSFQEQVNINKKKKLSQMQHKLESDQNLKQEHTSDKEKNKRQNEKFSFILGPYLKQICQPLKILRKISQFYKPKFIKNYLNQNEKISNIALSQQSNDPNSKQRSVEQILSYEDQFDQMEGQQGKKNKQEMMGKLKEFKLTFQNVSSLKGIQKFTSVEYVALQYNQIKTIKELQYSKKIIELNLSNNIIKDCKSLQNLPQLRYLNLSNNQIREFQFLGGSLEILDLKRNNVQIVTDLNSNKYLRIIDLTENKLHQLGQGFCKLYYLQELLLQKNYIHSLKGLQNLLMLQKLNISNNRLKQIDSDLVYIFLNTLNISYNQLEILPNMFLPSLEKLYITNNKITGEKINNKIYYLPELKQINLDDNQIKGFSTVWAFITFSKKLQIVKYDSNEYFLSVRQKVRELYEAIIYKYMTNLKIINHSPFDTGIKAYYDSVYSSYLQKNQKLSHTRGSLERMQQLVSFLLEENKVITNLEGKFSKIFHQRFIQKEVFIKAKSISRATLLEKVINMLSLNSYSHQKENDNQITQKSDAQNKIKKSQTNNLQSLSSLIQINEQIYFHHDKFQKNLLQKLHKIKSLFYKFKYKKQKRKKYFIKQKNRLIQIFQPIQKFVLTQKIKYAIKAFSKPILINKKEQAAIIIQKYWRGYKSRKLFKKLIKKLKNNIQDDDFQLQEVDLDDFETHQFPQFNFDLPEDINFQNYIIEPKYFQIAQEKQTKRKEVSKKNNNQNKNKKLQQIQEQKEEYNPMINNFMKQQKTKQQKLKKKQEDEKLMKQWGFSNPATLQALRWKKKRKQEMKRKQAEQNMTAAQRLEKFKMMHK